MKIEQQDDGGWAVINSAGELVHVARSNDDAWRWVDRNETHPSHLRRATADRLNAYDVQKK